MKILKTATFFFLISALFACSKEKFKFWKKESCGVITRAQRCYVFKDVAGYIYTIHSQGKIIYLAKKERYNIKEIICFNP